MFFTVSEETNQNICGLKKRFFYWFIIILLGGFDTYGEITNSVERVLFSKQNIFPIKFGYISNYYLRRLA